MKTIEETGQYLLGIATSASNTDDCFQKVFSDFVVAFAEERVKEKVEEMADTFPEEFELLRGERDEFKKLLKATEEILAESKTKARAEALEEARIKTLCNRIPAGSEDFRDGWVRACEFIDEAIRALKDKP